MSGAGVVSLGTGTLITGGNNTSTIYSGVMSGTGGLTKAGTGIFTLSGANTYTGATAINAGTLRVAGGAAIADTSAVTLANVAGAILDLNGTNETIGSLAGGGAAGGNVTLGSGTLTAGREQWHDHLYRGPEWHRGLDEARHGSLHPLRQQHLYRRHNDQCRNSPAWGCQPYCRTPML